MLPHMHARACIHTFLSAHTHTTPIYTAQCKLRQLIETNPEMILECGLVQRAISAAVKRKATEMSKSYCRSIERLEHNHENKRGRIKRKLSVERAKV